MKSLIAALTVGLLFPIFCFGQSQTGNASYNTSKSGYHISHASLSFGTRVRVTNLKNNREVITTVDGRIPPSDPRIADISKDVGDAIGMAASGYTELRIEPLPPEREAASTPVPVQPPAPVQPAGPAPASPPGNIQIVTPAPVQYVLPEMSAPPAPVQTVVQSCATSPLCVAILILLIIAVLLLAIILALILRHSRLPPWAWFYPVWVRRSLRRGRTR